MGHRHTHLSSRALPSVALALALALATASVASGCRATDAGGDPSAAATTSTRPASQPATDLAQAADGTVDAGTGRVDVQSERSTGTGPDQRTQAVTTRSCSYETGGARYGCTYAMHTIVDVDFTTVTDGTTMWLRSTQLAEAGLPEGSWTTASVSDLRSSRDINGLAVAPTDILDLLRGTPAAAQDEGTEVIDGVTTHHVHVVTTINRQGGSLTTERKQRLARALDPLGAPDHLDAVLDAGISLQVYLDPEGRVRRLDVTIESNPRTHEANHQVLDFHDLGAPVTITTPPPGPVVDPANVAPATDAPTTTR